MLMWMFSGLLFSERSEVMSVVVVLVGLIWRS